MKSYNEYVTVSTFSDTTLISVMVVNGINFEADCGVTLLQDGISVATYTWKAWEKAHIEYKWVDECGTFHVKYWVEF